MTKTKRPSPYFTPSEALVERVMRTLARKVDGMELPAVEKFKPQAPSRKPSDTFGQQEVPFQILIATLLSARTQDATTLAASTRLFKKAPTPRAVAALTVKQIEKLIYPVGFYRNKAVFVKEASQALVASFGGQVPATLEELISLPGVGRKTANLVLILAFHSETNICVDIHVHRIANRLGWVQTRGPEETEQALYRVIQPRWWPVINLYLVTWGQNICRPVYPRCGDCAIISDCRRVGVERVGKSKDFAKE